MRYFEKSGFDSRSRLPQVDLYGSFYIYQREGRSEKLKLDWRWTRLSRHSTRKIHESLSFQHWLRTDLTHMWRLRRNNGTRDIRMQRRSSHDWWPLNSFETKEGEESVSNRASHKGIGAGEQRTRICLLNCKQKVTLKRATTILIYEKGDPESLKSYRSISWLSVFHKIVGRIFSRGFAAPLKTQSSQRTSTGGYSKEPSEESDGTGMMIGKNTPSDAFSARIAAAVRSLLPYRWE